MPALTAEETLQYAADLRLPSPSTANDRTRVVKEVIDELGLKAAANSRVGNRGGLSGGEKRRVSIDFQIQVFQFWVVESESSSFLCGLKFSGV